MKIRVSRTAKIVLSVGVLVVILFGVIPIGYDEYVDPYLRTEARKAADEAARRQFRDKYLPQVGKEISITGKVQWDKKGYWISFDGEGASIFWPRQKPAPSAHSQLARLLKQIVRLTGTIYYDGDYFYFDENGLTVTAADDVHTGKK